MRLFLKVVFIGTGMVLIIVALLAIVAATQADKVARYQVENALHYIFQTDVKVESAELSLLGQSMKLRGVSVGNPKGFEAGPAMEFNEVSATFEGATLFSETPVISEVVVTGAKVNLEYVPKEGSNIGILLKESKRASLAQHSQQPRVVRREFLVKKLRCEGAKVNLATSVVPTPALELNVSPFTLDDISKDHPVNASQISVIFLKSLLVEAATFKGLLRPVAEFLRDELNTLLE